MSDGVHGELPSWEGSAADNLTEHTPIRDRRASYADYKQPAPRRRQVEQRAPLRPDRRQPDRRQQDQRQQNQRQQDQRQPDQRQPEPQPHLGEQQAKHAYFNGHGDVSLPPSAQVYQEPSSSPLFKLALVAAATVGLIAIGLGAFLLTRDNGDETANDGDQATGQITASSVEDPVEQVRLLLQGIGYEDVAVELRDNTLFVTGEVESRADVAAVVTASSSLAEGVPLNTEGLTVAPGTIVVDPADDAAATSDSETVATDPFRLLQVSLDRTVAAAPIIFEPAVTNISAWHTSTLDQVAQTLLANPGIAVSIVGYTDDSGQTGDNAAISSDRAGSVKAYLVDKGVPSGLLQIDPRGEAEASGLRDIGYLERRVEFDVVADGEVATAALRELEVGIIVPSPSNDFAFSQAMVEALDRLNSERGSLNTTISDNMFDVEAATELARQQAADGFDVVIMHGAQFRAIAEELAADHPDVIFVTGPVEDDADLPANVFAYSVAAEQGAYVLGNIAAQISASETIGIVGPVDASEPKSYISGFTAGVEAQGGNVLSEYIGSFNDVDAARAVAEAQVQAGADVLTGTAQMVTGPVALASEQGLPWFANQANQTELAPNNVVASQVYHFEVVLRPILAEIDAGATTGGTFPLTLGNGGVLLEFNPGYNLNLELRQQADELLLAVTAGSVAVDNGSE